MASKDSSYNSSLYWGGEEYTKCKYQIDMTAFQDLLRRSLLGFVGPDVRGTELMPVSNTDRERLVREWIDQATPPEFCEDVKEKEELPFPKHLWGTDDLRPGTMENDSKKEGDGKNCVPAALSEEQANEIEALWRRRGKLYQRGVEKVVEREKEISAVFDEYGKHLQKYQNGYDRLPCYNLHH